MKLIIIKQEIETFSLDLQRDAWFLLQDLLNRSRLELLLDLNFELTTEQHDIYEKKLTRLKKGEPLAYVLGNQPFWSLDFLVNEHTLIPRADTETLVQQSLAAGDALLENTIPMQALHVLEMGTGSGVIAICMKHERPTWQITATDMSYDALQVALKNAEKNEADVMFKQGSWYEALTTDSQKFHIIVSNPPYIEKNNAHLQALTYEPITALVAEDDGLADIKEIVTGATQFLHENGWLLIEHGYNQGEIVRTLFRTHGFSEVNTIQDYGKNDRVTLGKL